MKVLVVDDDLNKMRQLLDFVRDNLPDASVISCRSYQSGLKSALFERPDVILLDMTMPTYDVGGKETGGKERRYAGLQILRQLKRKDAETRAIVVTQFEQFGEREQLVTLGELARSLKNEFDRSYLGTVFYQAGDARWRDELKDVLRRSGLLICPEE
jgi:CheY-like chemotaxis protein